jgi:hypothetical protein
MTLWKQGASAVPVLARLRIIFGSAGIGIGGVLPIGTALVTEFAPRRIRATMIVMGVAGVALGGAIREKEIGNVLSDQRRRGKSSLSLMRAAIRPGVPWRFSDAGHRSVW